MPVQKETRLTPTRAFRDPWAMLRRMRSDMDRMFGEWPSLRFPAFEGGEVETWTPSIEVFEKENQLVTRVDLPGLKKEDVKVEVTDGQLVISGERRREQEEKKENLYRCEREYGSFFRQVPLPEGVKLEDVKANFTDGVLEVSVPLPVQKKPESRTVEIQEPVHV